MGEERRARPHKLRLPIIIGAGLVLLAGGVVGGGFLAARWPAGSVKIPPSVAEQVLFPMYTTGLPKNYRLLAGSFKTQEGTVSFGLRAKAGQTVTITEQAKPQEFDYTAFYQQQMAHPKNLQGGPYPSVLGSVAVNGTTSLLSIVTDKTWLLITSKNASEADLRFIAQHVHRQ